MRKFYQKYKSDDYCGKCGSKEVIDLPPYGIVKCAKCGNLGRVKNFCPFCHSFPHKENCEVVEEAKLNKNYEN